MRIRKRKVPFPLSSLSPVPLSDPHFNRSSSADKIQVLFGNSQSFDQRNNPIGDQDWSPDSAPWKREEKKVLLNEEENQKEEGEGDKSCSNDSRILSAKTPTMVFQESSSFHQDGRWCEEEKAFHFKNREGSIERKLLENEEKDKKMKTKIKTKMNEKCMQRNGHQEKEDHNEESHEDHKNSVKKRVRGGAVMEGSRCSRVNGRGWRCCQQTLVGYSLCEHHLGKGRLRSMTSFRRSMANNNATINKGGFLQSLSNNLSFSLAEEETALKHISLDDKIVAHGSKEEEKKPLMIGKKKQKLGMVKARSMSSLLGQANNAIVQVSENEY